MKPSRTLQCIMLIACWVVFSGAVSVEVHPLAPPDTSSPRALLMSFVDAIDNAYRLYIGGERRTKEIDYYADRAIRCLDMSEVAPSVAEEVGIESVLLLKEVLDRIELPPFEAVPDRAALAQTNYKKWVIPNTEITIALVEEGPRAGEYLFTSDTVKKLKDYYKKVKHLPYKPGASVGAYEDYVTGMGWMIPEPLIQNLPSVFKVEIYEQAVWQWLGMALVMSLGALFALLVYQVSRRRPAKKGQTISFLQKLLLPLTLTVLTQLLPYLLDEQINITGDVLRYLIFINEVVFFVSLVWITSLIGNATAELLISKPSIHTESIDANFIRVLFKVATILVLLLLLINATKALGIPLTAIFASAGIVGLALALAARETIANLFGGINILLDRPFRTGDYIILESGERGEVVEVGLRSIRMITRDDVQISIPNANITNAKIINESVPKNRFRLRVKIGVAYGSDVDQVEELLLQTAQSNAMVSPLPEPRVRFRSFGDSALEFELLCWAYQPDMKGKLMHQLNRSVYNTFNEYGINIPFPQREVLMKKDPMQRIET